MSSRILIFRKFNLHIIRITDESGNDKKIMELIETTGGEGGRFQKLVGTESGDEIARFMVSF